MSNIFESTKVEQIASTKTIQHLDHKSTVADALQLLIEKNILSAPIWDAEKKQYVGIVDMVDIVAFLISIFKETTHRSMSTKELLSLNEHFKKANVESISDLSRRDPWVPVAEGTNLKSLLEVLSNQRVHRVPVVDSSNKVLHFITQSDVVNFLSKNLEKIGPVAEKTVLELKLGSSPVVQASIDGTVQDAFQLMVDKKVSAVAVTDQQHHLIATISVKDLRAISSGTHMLQKLHHNIRDFLGAVVDPQIDVKNPAISCSGKDSLATVIQKLAVTRVHRIFVVNETHQPVAVISLSDVLGAILKH